MSEIKHILLESGVEEIFRLIVVSGSYAGTYDIVKPDGWDEVNSKIDINDTFFNIENFIIGETEKIQFLEYNNPETYNLIKNVYNELRGDGQIIFKYIAVKDGQEFDILGENFEINLNKYLDEFERSKRKISFEIKKREAQSKFLNREETTIDLFAEKDLDENDIEPIETFTIGYKKGDKVLTNFYFFDNTDDRDVQLTFAKYHIFPFIRSNEFQFGVNDNEKAGWFDYFPHQYKYLGPFVTVDILSKNVKIEISNFDMISLAYSDIPVTLKAFIDYGESRVREVTLVESTYAPELFGSRIRIENETFKIGNLLAGQSLLIAITADDGSEIQIKNLNSNASITVTTDLSSPLVSTKAVRVKDAINQVCKNYTSSEISFNSSKLLSPGGNFYNSSLSTGVYLRGLPSKYTVGQKIKTSFKSMFFDGLAPLMALGYDNNGDDLIVEDIGFFFKDLQSYDLSGKTFKEEDYKLENDKGLSFNQLFFGSKKYSTDNKDDIVNFNTTIETTTPIITVKNKFDKQTELIIDEFKIQELIEDNSSSTNNNDDDLVLIDLVDSNNYWDDAVFEDTVHANVDGFLKLTCITTPFDTTFIDVGTIITIKESLNAGTYTVLEVKNAGIILNKTSGIEEGVNDTPITYKIESLIKNRTGSETEGFTNVDNVRDITSSVNLRHNPKYQMARWFKYFGSGLTRKAGTDLIKINDYKNDSKAEMQTNDPVLNNELQGLVKIGEDEPLSRFRNQYNTLFDGRIIEITLKQVRWYEFMDLYKKWKFGIDDDLDTCRGYITVNTPDGLMDVYPFGDDAFSHSKIENELSIKGKVKGLHIENPILNSVIQIDRNTVKLEWDYSEKFINPTIDIQYSIDNSNWITVQTVVNVKESEFSSEAFNGLLTGQNILFRVMLNNVEFYNRKSNVLSLQWKYNDFAITEISRNENTDCGFSYYTFELKTTTLVEFNIDYTFESNPGGSSALVRRVDNNAEVVNLSIPYGPNDEITGSSTHSINNSSLQLQVILKNTDRTEDNKALNCFSGTNDINVSAYLTIDISNDKNSDVTQLFVGDQTLKYYYNRPIPEPEVPEA